MKTMMSLCLCLASAASVAAPTVGRFLVRQQWPWNGTVEIEYLLSGVDGPTDVTCEVYAGATRLPVPESAFGGVRYGLKTDGLHRMTFSPARAFAGAGVPADLSFRLTAAPQDPGGKSAEVLYKIFSLENGERTDITRGDLLNGAWGPVETDYGAIGDGYATELSGVCIWTGVTNYPHLKRSHVVLRKIDKGDFTLSRSTIAADAAPNVRLTEDFWIGVFEVTQAQFEKIYCEGRAFDVWKGNVGTKQTYAYGNVWTNAVAPVHALNTYMLCNGGWTSLAYGATDWTSSECFFGRIFGKTGLHFHLPTSAMWQKAARAGTRTWYPDGIAIARPASFDRTSNADSLGRYKGNGGLDAAGAEAGPVAVGSYRPNAYGLYDMFGNVREVQRDSSWHGNWPSVLTENFTPGADINIGVLGNWYGGNGQIMYSEAVQIHSASDRKIGVGFRLWLSDAEACAPVE